MDFRTLGVICFQITSDQARAVVTDCKVAFTLSAKAAKARVEKDVPLAALHQKRKTMATRGGVNRLEKLLTFPRSKESGVKWQQG